MIDGIQTEVIDGIVGSIYDLSNRFRKGSSFLQVNNKRPGTQQRDAKREPEWE